MDISAIINGSKSGSEYQKPTYSSWLFQGSMRLNLSKCDVESLVSCVHWYCSWLSMRTKWLINSVKIILAIFSPNFTTICKNISALIFSYKVHINPVPARW